MSISVSVFNARTTKGRLTASARRAIVELLEQHKAYKANGINLSMPRRAQWQAPATFQIRGLIELSEQDSASAIELVHAQYPRKKNIDTPTAGFSANHIHERTLEYKGNFKGWRGSALVYIMQSFGVIDATGKILGVIVNGKTASIEAGKGYKWDVDGLGIKLVRLSDDAEYHPDSSEVFSGFNSIRSALIAAAEARKIRAAIKTMDLPTLLRIMKKSQALVSVADSIAVGNCRAGTEAFCRILSINTESAKPVSTVIEAYLDRENHIPDAYKQRFMSVLFRVANRK